MIIATIVIVTGWFYFKPFERIQPNSPGKWKFDAPIAPAQMPATKAEFVGASTCAECHTEQYRNWQGSDHDYAMRVAGEESVLGNFQDAELINKGVVSRFFRKDGRFMVRTEGPDGKPADYEIKYTFGFTPLQQYLIEFPGGRYQVLGSAWDSRPESDGGQRWFSLYPNEKIEHNDPLHWTGRYQNWNLQCAECHSTHLRKNYDAASDSYKTTYAAINVACEACHGPGSQHVEWAKQASPPYALQDDKGLAIRLQSRSDEAWKFPSTTARFAQRDHLAADTLMNVCWPCHARRATLVEDFLPGNPLEDSHRPELLTQPDYFVDGQQREEDYTWASFRQSKMYQKGVTCMDCHDPHSIKVRAEGNALCARCHNAVAFDNPKHHFHKAGSAGAQCMNCHAPKQNYMLIDARHDHSFRLPRPDLSAPLGTPNACTQCHDDRNAEWAAQAIDQWFGVAWRNRPHYGKALNAANTEGVKALPSLFELAQDLSVASVVRATALTFAKATIRPEYLATVQTLLHDSDPSVRISALDLLEPFDELQRLKLALPMLSDPIFGVRIEAARILADVPQDRIPSEARGAFVTALEDYQSSLLRNADWPSANMNLGNLALRQERFADAIASYERALELDSRFIAAYVNLADVYRSQGQENEVEKILRKGLSIVPDAADLHHALGLYLVRLGNMPEALKELDRANRFAPDNAQYAYVYAVALNSGGKPPEALAVLNRGLARQPYDLNLLGTMISILREQRDVESAMSYAQRAADALPNDPAIKQLLMELENER